MVPNPSNNPMMFQIFQNVQYNIVQHKKYVKEMTKLYKKMAETSFRESFKNALHYLFTFGDTSANVDRVVQFVATFCTSLDDEEEFLLFIFDIIFDCQCVSGQSVRYRASQLLAAVLAALGEDASLDDDLCDKLLASQMQRLQDTRGAVRCRAALALQRLQNPMDSDDGVTRAYRFHMSCDPSSSVRRAVVMSIAKCTRNVPFVLERLCDVDEAVRRAAFLYISAINVTLLRVRQRLMTLKVGLNERSQRVRRVVEEILIPGWLSAFKGNIIDLLKAIRLDNAHDAKDSQQVAGKLLESLFKRLSISELLEWLPTEKNLRLIPAEKLNKETAWYWRHLAEHLQKIDDDETLELVLPDLVILTGYIKAIVEAPCPPESEDPVGFSTRQYVLHELACLLHAYDAGDQAGRVALQELITNVLTGDYGYLNSDVIRAFVTSLEMVIPEVSLRMEVISGVISALRDPPEVEQIQPEVPIECNELKLQRARLRVSLNVAIEAEEEAVREQNYALAEQCKAKVKDIQRKLEEMSVPAPPPPPVQPTIRKKVSDSVILNKCLVILNSALDTPHLTHVTPMLRMIFNDLEVEIFQNPELLENALETVALFGMLDKEFAMENKPFFFTNLIDTTNEIIMPVALRCIVDLLCVYGVKVFEDDFNDTQTSKNKSRRVTCDDIDEEGNLSKSAISMSPNHSTVIELLLKIMDSSYSNYRLIIAEGLCRLLHLCHLESPTVISRLILLWFNPATADEDLLRQIIGVFFQTFAADVEGAQEQIQRATIPTLKALANAPSSSPIAEIDQEAVVKFIASLTKISPEVLDSQGAMGVLLCSHLVQKPTATETALVCRMLALLAPPRDNSVISGLATMLRDICSKLPDKQSCRNITRYLGALEATERASMNKMSHADGPESLMQAEDSLLGGRMTTSMPHPIARSTHVVVNETVEEEVEIDETSPTEVISRISEEPKASTEQGGKKQRTSISSEKSRSSNPGDTGNTGDVSSDSSGVSPVKKAKVGKGKKKKLSMTRTSTPDSSNKETKETSKGKGKKVEKETGKNTAVGVKRSRSQRSLVDENKASSSNEVEKEVPKSKPQTETKPTKTKIPTKVKATKANTKTQAKSIDLPKPESPKFDLDVSNVTVRRSRSSKSIQSGSSTESNGSGKNTPKNKGKAASKKGKQTKLSQSPLVSPRSTRSSQASLFEDSANETELHTIVYDQEMVQSLLEDSSENLDTKSMSKTGNVTIPETPDCSDQSESELEIAPTPAKGKRNGKKK